MSSRRFSSVPLPLIVAALVALIGTVGRVARADVVRDGRIGSAGPGAVATEPDGVGGLRYLIRESDGQRAGRNLFHSLARMDLASNETAVYQGDAGIRNLVTTITGGRSSIDGRIASEIAGANLFLVNPDGIVFGENATVDLSGALTIGTADELIFADGATLPTTGTPPAMLSVADPVGFGFYGAPAPIRIEGSRIALVPDQSFALVGGDLLLSGERSDALGAGISVRSGRIDLVGLAGAGRVFLDPEGIRVTGDPRRGDIAIVDEMVVTTSGIDANPIQGLFVAPAAGSGPIFVHADDLTIRDAEVRTLTVTSEAAGAIAIDLSGRLTIAGGVSENPSGIFADTGFRTVPAPGQVVTSRFVAIHPGVTTVQVDACGALPCAVRYLATGNAGDIRIRAREVVLANGGKLTARSEFAGDAGTIEIDFEDAMSIVGHRGPGDVSLVSTNANGTGDPGAIRIRSASGDLALDDLGALLIQNSANSLASSLPGEIEVDVARLSMSGDARIDSSTRGAGPGGRLDISARERITLGGRTDAERFTGISTLAQPGSTGPAGEIRIATTDLEMEAGAEISARPADATAQGAAGDLRFEIGDRMTLRDATISTESPNAAGGNIDLAVLGRVDLRRSSITTSVTSGPESGGNITLRPGPEALVLDHGEIVARADAGAGGRIDLEAGIVISDASSTIDASSATGIDGIVLINGVEGSIVPEVADLATPSADASGLLREPCAARRPGASNRFVVEEGRRIALDVDDYLAAPLAPRMRAERRSPESARSSDVASEVAMRDAGSGSDAGPAPRVPERHAATNAAGCAF